MSGQEWLDLTMSFKAQEYRILINFIYNPENQLSAPPTSRLDYRRIRTAPGSLQPSGRSLPTSRPCHTSQGSTLRTGIPSHTREPPQPFTLPPSPSEQETQRCRRLLISIPSSPIKWPPSNRRSGSPSPRSILRVWWAILQPSLQTPTSETVSQIKVTSALSDFVISGVGAISSFSFFRPGNRRY